jgi:hypothetical protein
MCILIILGFYWKKSGIINKKIFSSKKKIIDKEWQVW